MQEAGLRSSLTAAWRCGTLRWIAMTPRSPVKSKPAVAVPKDTTVLEAVRRMVDRNVGATVVVEGDRLLGIFTERDVATRVVLKGLSPEKTPVSEVMTTAVKTVREDADRSSILHLMTTHHIRHLPVVDAEGKVLTILSMRHLLRAEVHDLQQTVWELVADTAIDGPGG
jgi:CBS domain-containing protein